MRTSRDPLQPLRSWKELFFGTRALKMKKLARVRERFANANVTVLSAEPHPATAE